MKNKLNILTLAILVAFTITAHAGLGDPPTPIDSTRGTTNVVINQTWPNGIGSETTVTNLTEIAAAGDHVQLEFSSLSTAASTTNTVIVLARSVTKNSITNAQGLGPNMKFEPFLTWTVPQSGTTRVTYTTNLTIANSLGGFPYYYVYTIKFGAAGILTNYTLKADTSVSK